jgi:D-alanine-D-alanine ligase
MADADLRTMRDVLLLYDAAALSGDIASRDVARQLDAIEAALRELGLKTMRLGVDLDLKAFKKRLTGLRPGLAFNLVESLDGSDRLQTVVPMLLEDWGIPFTGSGSMAMHLANHKLAAKRLLAERGLPTPPCAWTDAGGEVHFLPAPAGGAPAGDWIVKTVESHASLFIDDAAVLRGADAAALAGRLADAEAAHGGTFFAEGFVDGREFNVSILAGADGIPRVLPLAEISFDNLPAGRPRIVGYAAKWEEESPEYGGTERTFVPRQDDSVLRSKLTVLALETWNAFGLAGYARVDFRVDAGGNPFILEANANPCLSPDAGFAAAAAEGKIGFKEMVEAIVRAAIPESE